LHGRSRLGTFAQPFLQLAIVEGDDGWVLAGIIGTDDVEKFAIAFGLAVGDDDAIERFFLLAESSQSNTYCHSG
jgi:hypothetical protein